MSDKFMDKVVKVLITMSAVGLGIAVTAVGAMAIKFFSGDV